MPPDATPDATKASACQAGPVEQGLRAKIEAAFAPQACSIHNDSPAHQGHAGAEEALHKGESHFSIRIVSEQFDGTSRLQRNRAVHHCLAEELQSIHALSLDLKTPQEVSQEVSQEVTQEE